MSNGTDFAASHQEAMSQVKESRSKEAISRFLNSAMNMKPINAVDALVAAYAIQSAAKIDGGMGAMGIKRTRGNTFNISDLQPKEREAVIGICLLYKAKQIKRSMAIDAISHYFSTDDQKTLARILNDGKKQWGGLVEFIENQSGEPPRFKERLNKI